ncbi:uncharacterized protein PV07_03815 [Cladophialophora immunda]|uniref:Uncharacterized protein n=1 Tax=Cladophialophora immunda TaxID=569365 RepID=A0A0D2CQJ8_9EURO|nr:uncharacterized protein PV07_03815 [Cladophialophora immunda]KIW32255.1 hypothetical protein PV07_03815 [Cladophialophora immunda]
MEAVAALSLACNIIQVVDSSFKAVETCIQIYKHGTTIDIEHLSYTSDQLSQSSEALDKAQSVQARAQLSKNDADLIELGKKVHDAAESLSKELNSLKSAPGAGRRAALVKTIALKWRASRIEELKRRLEGLVQVLDNKILVQLSEKLSVTIRNQGDIPKMLDERQEEIARKIAEGTTNVAQLVSLMSDQARAHVTQEHIDTRNRIDTIDKKIDKLVDVQHQKAEFDKFKQSLHFPEINLRQDKIEEAHEKTFEWIFEKQDTSQRWHNFPDWLQNDQPLYWILGKPGSGKSTLMNFLVHDRRTLEGLESSGQPVTILSFFFWEAGVELQKSRVGLLRSLIYQLLEDIDQSKALQVWSDVIQPHIPALPVIWTNKQLLHLLQLIVHAVDQRFCFFLDGLDEFQDDVDGTEAIRSLQDVLNGQNRIKMCISSRPQINLRELYQGCPNLVMQNLTKADIRRYVEDKLLRNPLTVQLGDEHSTQVSRLLNDVGVKAEGVFLWVTLAVQSLLRGIKNEDRWDTLRERLDQLPSGIFDLYTHMWRRMADDYPIYAQEAALYLRIIQQFGPKSLVRMAIMVDDDLHASFSKPAASWRIEQLELKVNYEKTEKRIAACCAGFLEVMRLPSYPRLDEHIKAAKERLEHRTPKIQPDIIERWLDQGLANQTIFVDFVHRTAAEFLNTSAGQELLRARLCTEEELVMQFLRSDLILSFLAPQGPTFDESAWMLFPALSQMEPDTITQYCSELEAICRQLFAWGLWDMHELDPRLLMRGRLGEVDYIKLFFNFCHPQYVMNKLNEDGLANDRDYINELLVWWAYGQLSRFNVIQIGLLLIQLGADPNQILHPKAGLNSLTIWTAVITGVSFRQGNDFRSLVPQLLEAGADPKSGLTCCFEWGQGKSYCQECLEPSISNAFILCKWSVLDMVTEFADEPANVIESTWLNSGAVSTQKQILWFQPPISWRISPNKVLKGRIHLFYSGHGDPPELLFDLNDHTLDDLRELYKGEFRAFSNGLDAIHAAGWTDEEIRTTPGLERLWEELQEADHKGQEGHTEIPVRESNIENA